MTELIYREISCQKSVIGADFERGNQDYNFSMGAPTAWIPSKSYFRITLKLSSTSDAAGAGNQPTISNQLAFADNVAACLYNNAYFKAGGQDVSSIVNYIPQASALLHRTSKSQAWLNSIGKSAYMLNADFQERVNVTASDDLLNVSSQQEYVAAGGDDGLGTVTITEATGAVAGAGTKLNLLAIGDILVVGGVHFKVTTAATNPAGAAMVVSAKLVTSGNITGICYGLKMKRRDGGSRNQVHVLFQPPIGIFQHHEPMGAGDYRFSLNPNSNFKKACVESTRDPLTPGTSFDITVQDVKLYIATVKTNIPKSITNLALVEMLVQTKPASANRTYEFTVPSSTLSLCFFVQSGDAGSNTQSPPTTFKCKDRSQNNIESLQITYANMTKPSTRWDSEFKDGINKFQQRYIDDLTECRLIESDGGAESFGEWLQRGPYYFYSFNRDREDKSTQVQLSAQFTSIEADAQMFLVAMYSRVTEISVDEGIVQSVRSLDR
jgi:hypothetical protein